MGKTVRALSTDRVRAVKAEDLELEPDDIIRIIDFHNNCEHPEWRKCFELDSDNVIYECVECSFVRDSMPKPKPLSEDMWL